MKALSDKKVPELRGMCEALGLECSGKKADLILQLLDAKALTSKKSKITVKAPPKKALP